MKARMRKQLKWLWLLVALGLAAGCGPAGGGTTEPEPQEESAETQVPTQTPQEMEPQPEEEEEAPEYECEVGLPGGPEWPVLLCEAFEDNRNQWQLESQDNPYARYTSEINEGQFQIDYSAKVFANFTRSAITWFDVGDSFDFTLSVSGLMDTRLATSSWGVAFRADEEMDSFFLFTLYNDGTYALDIYENRGWIPLIGRRPHNSIQLGQENQVTIVAEGQDFAFYINDQPVNIFEGGLLEGSSIRLMVSAGEGVSAGFLFDDLVLQQPPSS